MNYTLCQDWQAQVGALMKEVDRLEKENAKLRADLEKERKKNSGPPAWLDEALNTGDGSYKP